MSVRREKILQSQKREPDAGQVAAMKQEVETLRKQQAEVQRICGQAQGLSGRLMAVAGGTSFGARMVTHGSNASAALSRSINELSGAIAKARTQTITWHVTKYYLIHEVTINDRTGQVVSERSWTEQEYMDEQGVYTVA